MRRYRRTAVALLCAAGASAWFAADALAVGSPGAAAWGAGGSGQLGDSETASSSYPAPIHGLTGVTAVAGAHDHGLALLATGKVMAWGDNASGDLGNASTTPSDVPVEVSGISTAVAIAAGQEFSLALLANGTVMAWGQNKEGELGDGNISSSDVPVAVKGLTEVSAIAAGSKHALALLKSGTVKAWGADGAGQLGNATTTTGEVEAVATSELSEVASIAAGGLSSYAVLKDGTVKAWGDDNKGQLGNGSTTSSDVPVAVQGLVGAQSVSAGENHALAVVTGGSVYAWGNGASGELGNGTETSSDQPVLVMSLTEVTSVAAGTNFSLALLAAGSVDAWGANNEGQLGNGSTTGSDTPVAVATIAEVKGIAAGGQTSLAFGPKLPAVTALTPNFGPATGSTSVKITGTGFNGVTSVHFGSTSVSFTRESETTIAASSPAGTGVVDVRVTIAGGTSPVAPGDRFSYTPVVSKVSPATGPQTGATEVTITGVNMSGVSAVSFGSNAATSFKDESATEVIAISPAGVGIVDVKLTGPGGTSEAVAADQFTYTSNAPELGRCRVAGKHHASVKGRASARAAVVTGKWADRGCTEESSEGKYEWEAGPGKPSFKLKSTKGSVTVQTVEGASVGCKKLNGTGEYSGARSLKALTMNLIGCSVGKTKCKSAAASHEGEIQLAALKGEYGVIEKGASASESELGVDISPASGTVLAEFECGGTAHVWRGSVIAPVRANRMEKTVTINFAGAKGLQKVERFEGSPLDVIESSIAGGAYEQAALSASLALRGKAEIEINSVH